MKFLAILIVAAGLLRAESAPPPPAPTALRNVAYVTGGHARQKLDLFLPPNQASPAPLLVWIHGGAWKEGSKENCPAVGMVAKGWAVASLNYRLSQHAAFPAQIEDCKAALRFLRARAGDYRIDKDRVAVWGASAGGHLALLLGTTGKTREFDVGEHLGESSRVACVINWFGPADFLHWGGPDGRSPNHDEVVAKLLGGPLPEKRGLARKASPLTWVDADSAPTLTMHGDRDRLVPVDQSKSLAAAFKAAGVPHVLKIYPGQGHGGPRFHDDAARELMIAFVEKHTAPAEPAAGQAESRG
jgi:acetyl esterase/lipase